MNFAELKKNLEEKSYEVHIFETAEEAKKYLSEQIHDTTVAIGGSMTAEQMGLYEELSKNNKVHWHWRKPIEGASNNILQDARQAEIYISSVNAISEQGDIVNIDGTGNRVSATIFGHKKVFFLIGKNKLAETLEEAVERAKTKAAKLNAERIFKEKMDEKSVDKISCVLSVFWRKPTSCPYEVILINEDLGY